MKKYLWLFLTALCSYIFYFFSLPPSTPYTSPPLPVQEQLLLVPLDSRPPCTLIAQDLGRLASIDVILPPKELLDNYRTPANCEKPRGVLPAARLPAIPRHRAVKLHHRVKNGKVKPTTPVAT